MTPRERKAMAYLAKHFGIDPKEFDPMGNDKHADDVVKRLGLLVTNERIKAHRGRADRDEKRGRSNGEPAGGFGGVGWAVRRSAEEEPFLTLTGGGTRNAAIVEAACIAIDPNWYKE